MMQASVGMTESKKPTLLQGDQIQLFFNNIAHLHSHTGIVGDLFITKYQLIFQVHHITVTRLLSHPRCHPIVQRKDFVFLWLLFIPLPSARE